MSFRQRKIADYTLDPQKLSANARKYSYTDFPALGFFSSYLATAAGYGDPTGATGDLNYWEIPLNQGGSLWAEYHIKGAGQTILAPRFSSDGTGPNVALDLTSTEGAEYLFGGDVSGRGKHVYTIGTSPAFFAKIALTIADVSGVNPLLFGFRKVEAAQAVYTSYTDYALIGAVTAANPAAIKTATRLNTGTAVIVDTTQTKADATQMTLEVWVDQLGVVTFILDGAFPTVTQSFTFDSGDQVMPILSFLHAATTPGVITLQHFSSGFLSVSRP